MSPHRAFFLLVIVLVSAGCGARTAIVDSDAGVPTVACGEATCAPGDVCCAHSCVPERDGSYSRECR
jgi:hypothetical protein